MSYIQLFGTIIIGSIAVAIIAILVFIDWIKKDL